MSETAPDSGDSRPFGVRDVRERSFFDRVFKTSRPSDAQTAIENLIAENGLDGVDAAAIDACLRRFGVRAEAAKPVLLSVWRKAIEHMVSTDGILDSAEATFLEGLQRVLALSDDEAKRQQDDVLRTEFVCRARRLLTRADVTSEETRNEISRVARHLRVSPLEQKSLAKPLAQAAFTSIIRQSIAERSVTKQTVNAFGALKEEYDLVFEDDDQNKLARCWHLSLLDEGTLPTQQVEVLLNESEICHFGAATGLFEPRKARRSGISYDSWQLIDQGALYITDRRMLFVASSSTKATRFPSLTRMSREENILLIQRSSGKTQKFVFANGLDAEAALRILEDRCGARRLIAITPAAEPKPEVAATGKPATAAKPPAEPRGTPEALQPILDELDALTGLDAVKQEVRSLINYLRVQRLRLEQGLPIGQVTTHLVFTGNPGTGKTTVARLLARLFKALGFLSGGQLVETDRSGLVAGFVGQTAIKTAEMVAKALGGVLFIDEAYSLARPGSEGTADAYGLEAIDTLLKAMEDNRDELVVIVAGYTEPMQRFLASNPGLQSRFTRFINFPDYAPDELIEILKRLTSRGAYTFTPRLTNTPVICSVMRTRCAARGSATLVLSVRCSSEQQSVFLTGWLKMPTSLGTS